MVINNNQIVGNAINPVNYQGFRLSALYKFNDDWNALLTQSYQNMDAQGVFYEMPYGSEGTTFNAKGVPIGSQPLPPLSVTLFNNSYDKDKFENTALTVNGQVRRHEAHLQRWLPGAQCRAGSGLHELRPRHIRLLLSVHGLVEQVGWRGHVLHAKRNLAGHRKEHSPKPRDSPEHPRRLAHTRARRPVLRATRHRRQFRRRLQERPDVFTGDGCQLLQQHPAVARLLHEPAGHTK